MSIVTSVFHTYGFLITEEAATIIFRHIKEHKISLNPELYELIADSEDFSAFQEYLANKYSGCCYGNAEYMTVWRIKDHEELDLDPGDEFYIIELQNFPQLFSQAYPSYEDILLEMQRKFEELLPPDFPFDDFLVEIMGEVWG